MNIRTNLFVDCGMTGNSIDKAHHQRLKTPVKNQATIAPVMEVAGTTYKNVLLYVLDLPAV